MLLRERPLLADGIDAAVYAPRTVGGPLLDAALAERNTLLLGEAGSGKTTLLRWLRARLRDSGRRCAFVNASVANDVSSLADLVAAGLEDAWGPDSPPLEPASTSGETVPRAVRLLQEVRRLRTPEPVVVLVDGLGRSAVAHDWFGRLRDEVWALGHTWVVAARPVDAAPFRTPPADAFWSLVLEVPRLSVEERDAMLERGLEPEERTLVGGAKLPPNPTPRELVSLLREVLARSNGASPPAEFEAWSQQRRERAATLGQPEQLALAELEAIGRPVSVHDDDLLRRLEWSRPYAQRVLGRLEDAGLVRVIPERGGGQGRPRKLYEPAPLPGTERA
jgi:hypothetical protein